MNRIAMLVSLPTDEYETFTEIAELYGATPDAFAAVVLQVVTAGHRGASSPSVSRGTDSVMYAVSAMLATRRPAGGCRICCADPCICGGEG